ncbi:MAG TPA: four helix bundle protein, partial [Gemmatimonadaceae bacterium]|nr:four helix bundle protein [Gemmatimonadaceae bacterium]
EGACRGRDGEFLRFIAIAIGSAGEADSLLIHAAGLGALDTRTARALGEDITVIRKMLFKLRKSLQQR